MNDLTTTAPRLPVPQNFDPEQWRVLTEAVFPNARSTQAILLAIAYCKARKLDIMKRPVNIVPMWNSQLGREVETVWPSINEIEVTASRTKEWAGMDDPRWGPEITETFEGRRKDRRDGWVDVSAEVTFPEWCSVTVYRMVNGQRCGFTEPVWWKEAYGRTAGTAYPNDMWQKRPKGQLLKVAKAFSLRAAFPEEGAGPTDAEMEGQATAEPPPEPPKPTDNWRPPIETRIEASENTAPPRELPANVSGNQQKATQSAVATAGSSPSESQSRGANPEERKAGDPHDAGDVIDRETGEVISEQGPRAIARGKDEPWRDWCSKIVAFVRNENDIDVIEQWVAKNKQTIGVLMKEAPKLHSQLSAAIGKRKGDVLKEQDEREPQ